jgi:hypothetical protein
MGNASPGGITGILFVVFLFDEDDLGLAPAFFVCPLCLPEEEVSDCLLEEEDCDLRATTIGLF